MVRIQCSPKIAEVLKKQGIKLNRLDELGEPIKEKVKVSKLALGVEKMVKKSKAKKNILADVEENVEVEVTETGVVTESGNGKKAIKPKIKTASKLEVYKLKIKRGRNCDVCSGDLEVGDDYYEVNQRGVVKWAKVCGDCLVTKGWDTAVINLEYYK